MGTICTVQMSGIISSDEFFSFPQGLSTGCRLDMEQRASIVPVERTSTKLRAFLLKLSAISNGNRYHGRGVSLCSKRNERTST